MAELLGISRDTVVRAYQDLMASGYLETKTGARTVVRKNASTLDAEQPIEGPACINIEQSSSPPLSGYAQRVASSTSATSTPTDQASLEGESAPADLLPTKHWRTILSRHCALQETTGDVEASGHCRLREAIASYLKRSKAINCHADQILVLPDSQMAVDLIARILVDPGDVCAVENPGNTAVRETLLSHGAQLQPISIDSNGLVVEELALASDKCKMVYVTPAHHDPTGAVMSLQRRGELLQWARAHNTYIVEDATDSDYRYGGQPIPAIQGLDGSGLVIYLYSFEKTLFPLVGTACLVLPPQLVDVFAKATRRLLRNHATVDDYTLADFILDGHLERHIWRTRSIYARRRRTLIIELYKKFKEAVTVAKENAGLHLMVRFNVGVSDEQLKVFAHQAGLRLVSTANNYMKNAQPGEFLIPFAGMTEDDIVSIVACFAELTNQAVVAYTVPIVVPHV